jgi:hypothetical protein
VIVLALLQLLFETRVQHFLDRIWEPSASDEWDVPPKPKWMRWATYNRYVERFDDYERMLDEASISAVVKRLG